MRRFTAEQEELAQTLHAGWASWLDRVGAEVAEAKQHVERALGIPREGRNLAEPARRHAWALWEVIQVLSNVWGCCFECFRAFARGVAVR